MCVYVRHLNVPGVGWLSKCNTAPVRSERERERDEGTIGAGVKMEYLIIRFYLCFSGGSSGGLPFDIAALPAAAVTRVLAVR